jgi:hypothetical protein
MEQLLAHIQQLLAVLIATHAVAIAIVNLTPTPKDNDQVAKFYKIIEIFAGIITKLAKK